MKKRNYCFRNCCSWAL